MVLALATYSYCIGLGNAGPSSSKGKRLVVQYSNKKGTTLSTELPTDYTLLDNLHFLLLMCTG